MLLAAVKVSTVLSDICNYEFHHQIYCFYLIIQVFLGFGFFLPQAIWGGHNFGASQFSKLKVVIEFNGNRKSFPRRSIL